MKKKIVLLLATVLSISLCACGGGESSSGSNAGTKAEESEKEVIITKEELETYSEYIELTTENWNEYIEIVEKEVVEKDAFGEETGKNIMSYVRLKDYCFISEDNAIRFTFTFRTGPVSTKST